MTTSFLQKNIPVLTDVISTSTPATEPKEVSPAPSVPLPVENIPEVADIQIPTAVIPAPVEEPKKAFTAPYLVPTPAAPVANEAVVVESITETSAMIKDVEVTQEALWSHWKDEITENVMQTLLADIDANITQTVQTQLQQTLTHMSAVIAEQIKMNLEKALQETVTLAIEEELQKFKN